MSISVYEAAAAYDYTNSSLNNEQQYLVIDLDSYSAGICVCSKSMKTSLQHEYSLNGTETMPGDIINALKTLSAAADEQAAASQLETANRAMNNYLLSDRDSDNDPVMFRFSEDEILCSAVENSLTNVKKKVMKLLDYIQSRITEEQMEEIRIILLGKSTEFSLIPHWLREELSADPFIADERFVNHTFRHDLNEITVLGRQYCEAVKKTLRECTLVLFDGLNNRQERIRLVSADPNQSKQSSPAYFGPVYIAENEKLHLESQSSKMDVELPYSFSPMNSDLIDLAVVSENDTLNLMIRRSRFPAKIFRVSLEGLNG